MAIFLRQSHNVKPERWGSEADVQYAIAKNSEKIYGVDPDSNVLVMPLFFGFPCLDFSGKQNHGTPVGGVAYHSGSLDFDGVDDQIMAGTKASLEVQENTFSAWIKPTNFATVRMIAGKSDDITAAGIEWGVYFGGELQYAYYDTAVRGWYRGTSATLTAGAWNYATIVWRKSAGYVDFYVNGNFIQSVVTTTGTIKYLSDTFDIGHAHTSANPRFLGLIDEARINNITLTAEQIALFYARKWDLYRRVGRTYYSIAAAPSIYIPQIMIF